MTDTEKVMRLRDMLMQVKSFLESKHNSVRYDRSFCQIANLSRELETMAHDISGVLYEINR